MGFSQVTGLLLRETVHSPYSTKGSSLTWGQLDNNFILLGDAVRTLQSTTVGLTSLSASTPLSYNNVTGVFGIQLAGSGQSGYLSSTDWNTFNNKVGLSSFSATAPMAYNSGTGGFSMPAATSSQNGYLTSANWTTFNNKIGLTSLSGTSPVTYNNATGAIGINTASTSTTGALTSTDWNTFNGKIGLASLSATSPIFYNNSTGVISSQAASTSQAGYMSAANFTIFSKAPKTLISAISTNTITSTTSETAVIDVSKCTGTKTINSTDWVVGDRYIVELNGQIGNNVTSTNVQFKVRIGGTSGTVIFDTDVVAMALTPGTFTGSDAFGFYAKYIITCRATGASGKLLVDGYIDYVNDYYGGTPIRIHPSTNQPGAIVSTEITVDLTTNKTIEPTVQFSTTSGKILVSNISIERKTVQ